MSDESPDHPSAASGPALSIGPGWRSELSVAGADVALAASAASLRFARTIHQAAGISRKPEVARAAAAEPSPATTAAMGPPSIWPTASTWPKSEWTVARVFESSR